HAAVGRIPRNEDFAAVGRIVVAVRVAGVARADPAHAPRTRRGGVLGGAHQSARAAVVRIVREIHLAAVGWIVVAIPVSDVTAADPAHTPRTRRRGVLGGTDVTARAAIVGVVRDIDFAAI